MVITKQMVWCFFLKGVCISYRLNVTKSLNVRTLVYYFVASTLLKGKETERLSKYRDYKSTQQFTAGCSTVLQFMNNNIYPCHFTKFTRGHFMFVYRQQNTLCSNLFTFSEGHLAGTIYI